MQNNYNHKHLLEQYPQDTHAYPLDNWQPYGNIQYRSFSGNRKEDRLLKKMLLKKMGCASLVRRIISGLEEKDMVLADQLMRFTRCISGKFSAYADDEPCTAAFYRPLLTALGQFLSLVIGFHERTPKDAAGLRKTYLLYAGAHTAYPDLEGLDDIIFEMENFSGQLFTNHEYFTVLLKRETDDCCGVNLTSQVEQDLLKLLALIRENASATKESRYMMEALLQHWIQAENETLYN